ncbi:MAG: CotH kinase family protein [Clostridia bacterium]|nr:CotH kinase family protein [Clostridia bacterium]
MKKRETKLVIVMLVLLAVFIVAGIIIDRFRSVTYADYGEAEDVDIIISEICASNRTILADSNGKYSDYIELYNRGKDCDLRGFTVSDGKTTSEPFGPMPFAAGEYKVIFLGKANTGFALSTIGNETISLYNRDGTLVTRVKTVSTGTDLVMSWHGAGYEVTDRATPGFENTSYGEKAFREGIPDDDPTVVINELLVRNRTALPDEHGRFSDIIELHNRSSEAVSLGGYYLSDRQENRFRYALPSVTLPAGGFLVVYADGEAMVAETGEIHTNFGLSVGETLILTSSAGKYTSAQVTSTSDGTSILRNDDGTYSTGTPSPGFANDAEGIAAFLQSRINPDAALVVTEVLLDKSGIPYDGMLTDAVEIYNRTSEPVNAEGWYLTDGEDPYRFALPSVTVEPHACIVIVCDGTGEGLHANFSLSSDESVTLTGPDWKRGVTAPCGDPGIGKSWNLVGTGEDAGFVTDAVSIGFPNDAQGMNDYLRNARPETIQLSEAVSANVSTLKGPYGATADWIELYNGSSQQVSLYGKYLTDDPENLTKGKLPGATLQPGEYYVAFASESGTNLPGGYPVMPFNLSSSGDAVYLTDGEKILDCMILPALEPDTAYGRPKGKDGFGYLAGMTPCAANAEEAHATEKPVSLTKTGVYNGVSFVDVNLSGDGRIYYTLDCEEPTPASPQFGSPIRLTKTTVIRAICVKDGCTASGIADFTYIINENHTLPVASLVTTPENLWDYYHGIYVEGPNAQAEFPHVGANYWQQWEKPATVSLFEKDGTGFYEPCGIRIFGAYSRALDMKSLSCFFRSKYGASSLDYALFGEEGLDSYEAFIFRNTGQDQYKARMRDPLLTGITAAATDVAVQKYRPVVLYLNGSYWGVYFIREKINENYVAGNYNVSKEDVILTRANGTACPEYTEMINWVKGHDLSVAENYAYICEQIDIDEYIDYIVAEIIICNTDNGNIKFFKTTNGKWTWIMYDVDQSFRSADFNTVAEHLNPNGTGSMDRFSTLLINRLLKNQTFKDKFLTRFGWQLTNVWNPENVNKAVDSIYEQIQPEMARDTVRWENSYSDWEAQVRAIRTFANTRTAYVLKHVQSYFKLTDAQMKSYGFPVSA